MPNFNINVKRWQEKVLYAGLRGSLVSAGLSYRIAYSSPSVILIGSAIEPNQTYPTFIGLFLQARVALCCYILAKLLMFQCTIYPNPTKILDDTHEVRVLHIQGA